jgi:hypothetical protein
MTGTDMSAVPTRTTDLYSRLGLDQPTPLSIRREAARELCAEIFANLDASNRAQEFAERAAFIMCGDPGWARPVAPRMTAHALCQFVAAGLPT